MGLTIADRISKKYDCRILMLEKETDVGKHGSGRNSGVLHSGIYYKEGSSKARLCHLGRELMEDYCDLHGLPIKRIGKIILPTNESEVEVMHLLNQRAIANGASVEILGMQQLKQEEPDINSNCGSALYSPNTSIVAPLVIVKYLSKQLCRKGVTLLFGQTIKCIDPDRSIVEANGELYHYGHIINTAGQYTDRIAQQFNFPDRYIMIPFRGAYYELASKTMIKLRHLIYPVPDLVMPFLGIHSVNDLSGRTYFGPSAFPALGRENYKGVVGLNVLDVLQAVPHLGYQYLANIDCFRDYTHRELTQLGKSGFLKAIKRLVPGITLSDLKSSDKVGIRAQLYDKIKKTFVMDFLIESKDNSTHVLNAVSPAFTSSFAMADEIVESLVS